MAPADIAGHRRFCAAVIAVATAVGAALRLAGVTQLDLSHSDEGVYAIWASGVLYPGREFFAPPLFPALLRCAALVVGSPQDWVFFLVCAVLGTLTVPLVAATAWYGSSPLAGAVAAWLVAVSGWHIAFSRSVLTDVMYANLLGLAVLLTAVLLRTAQVANCLRRYVGTMCLLALTLSAAAYTKYHFPVLLGGLVLGMLVSGAISRGPGIGFLRAMVALLFAVGTALAAYLAWAFHVEQTIGYSRLLAHHRGYFEGLRAWFWNARDYLGFSRALCRVQDVIVLAGALAWLGLRTRSGLSMLVAVSLLAGVAAVGELIYPVWALAYLCWPKRTARPPLTLLGTVLCLLVVLTPCYRPYARLCLPLLQLAWPLVGIAVSEAWTEMQRPVLLTAICLSTAFALWVAQPSSFPTECPPSTRSAAQKGIESTLQTALENVDHVYAYARPYVIFYAMRETRVTLIGDPRELLRLVSPAGGVLVDRALALDNPQAIATLSTLAERSAGRVQEIDYCPSLITLLDDYRALGTRHGTSWPYRLMIVETPTKQMQDQGP